MKSNNASRHTLQNHQIGQSKRKLLFLVAQSTEVQISTDRAVATAFEAILTPSRLFRFRSTPRVRMLAAPKQVAKSALAVNVIKRHVPRS